MAYWMSPEENFQVKLTAFRLRLAKLSKIRQIEPDLYLQALRQLRYDFNHQLAASRRQTPFTLPMLLALGWVQMQAFWMLRWPEIQLGWQQASQSFQGSYTDRP
ncbi:MAG: hypothetical protein AAF152_07695 [Cyanobacteria bacterium P01_A01_bin.114]